MEIRLEELLFSLSLKACFPSLGLKALFHYPMAGRNRTLGNGAYKIEDTEGQDLSDYARC